MADITLVKISALPAAEQIGAEDLLPVVQEGATKAVAYGVIKDDIANELAPDATLSEAGKAADAKAVGDALALKADKTEVTAEVNRIDAALATKANTNDVNAALATKANADDVTAALATKANTNDVTEALALKADTATVNEALTITNGDINGTIGALLDKTTYDSVSVNLESPTVTPYHTYKAFSFTAGRQYGLVLRLTTARTTPLKQYISLYTTSAKQSSAKVDDITDGYVDQNTEYQAFAFTPTADASYLAIYIKNPVGNPLNYDLYILDSLPEKIDSLIADALTTKQDVLTFETTPTEGSTNPVTSGGIWQAALKNVSGSGLNINTEALFVAPYDDLNTLPHNRIITYSSLSYVPANVPSGLYSGFTTVTLSRSLDGQYASAAVQLLVGRVTGGAVRSELYYRISWGGVSSPTWSDWKQAETAGTSFMGINLSLFERVGVIGDSFASGSNNYNEGVTNYAVSWLQIMKRMHGWTEADNYSKGGLTSRTWLTNAAGLQKLNETGWKQLYFIALGINDSNPDERNVPVGVIADFTNTTTPPDTFYGNMGQIYRAIKAKNSAAVVCFITIPRFDAEGETPRYAPYDAAIKAMASATHSILIDSNTIGLFHLQSWTNNLASLHPVAPLYSAMAKAYSRAFEDAALANIGYLKTYNGYLNGDPTATEPDNIGE